MTKTIQTYMQDVKNNLKHTIRTYIKETKRSLKEIGQEFFLIPRDSKRCETNCKIVRWLIFANILGLIIVATANVIIK